jgi:hypothetical protein
MKLLDNQLDKPSLSSFGEEACRFFIARDFQRLADTFSYALAYDRDIATAIKADFERCVSGHSTLHGGQSSIIESITVKNFRPNDTGLLAVVECVLLLDNCARVLIELIAAKNGKNTNLYLEDINALT